MVGNAHDGPGRFAPAPLLSALLIATAPAAAAAQQPPRAPAASPAVPDQLSLAKLLWSTMAAIDHGNRTGNYSVLRELGSPAFQAGNDVAALAAVFAPIRRERIDLADTLLFEPHYEFAPGIVQGLLRMRGMFRMRPRGIQFDLLYQWNNGWRLHGVALQAVPTTVQPAAQQRPPERGR